MPTYYKYQQVTTDEAVDENGVLKDGHSVRVSVLDAMAARSKHMTDAERRVADYAEWQRATGGSRPGWRIAGSQMEREDRRTVLEAAYKDADAANAAEFAKRLGGPNTAAKGRAFTGQTGATEGSICSINGAPGHLKYNSDGELECVADDQTNNADAAFDDRAAAYAEYEARLTSSYLGDGRRKQTPAYNERGGEAGSYVTTEEEDDDDVEKALSDYNTYVQTAYKNCGR